MLPPQEYTPSEEFADFSPSAKPGMGLKLDIEFNNLKITTDEIRDNLAVIQRDDGQLANGIVNRDALDAAVAAGVNTPTTWATATDFTERDSVIVSSVWYWATESHTSGTFATDLAAGLWEEIFDFTSLVQTVVNPSIAALLSDALPATPAATPSAGVSTKVSRDDHVHDIYDGSTPTTITDSAGSTGVATAAARADHTHPYTTPPGFTLDEGQVALYAGVYSL